MKKIKIDSRLKELWPEACLGCIQCRARVEKPGEALLLAISETEKEWMASMAVGDIVKRPRIADTRGAYKAFGKEPSRYRNSAEAMHRRILQGKGLYQVNNVVDGANLFSIRTGYALGAYDVAKIKGEITWQIAEAGECYKGIGKEEIKIEFLPALFDEEGAFGNPTSDSTRTMITEEAGEVLVCVFGFSGTENLERELDGLVEILKNYCGGEQFEKVVLS